MRHAAAALAFLLAIPPLGLAQDKPGVSIRPYGFILLSSVWDTATFSSKDYPGQADRTQDGGAFLMTARQSRVGLRLAYDDEAGFTQANLSGILEFDFSGGHLQGASSAWHNAIVRLRLAYAQAEWKLAPGKVYVGAGQEHGLVAPLFATSLAWTADPIFWQSGNAWRRAPQIRVGYEGRYGDFGVKAAGAILSPADAGAPVDFGEGNRSRRPAFDFRIAGSYLRFAEVGLGYSTHARRFPAGGANPERDVRGNLLAVDIQANAPYLAIKGEWYTGKAAGDIYNGTSPAMNGVAADGSCPVATCRAVGEDGFWVQAVLKPAARIDVPVGYGQGRGDRSDLAGSTTAGAPSRQKNTQLALGVIVGAGNFWRFGLEGAQVETTYVDGLKAKAQQIALSSKLDF